MNKQMNKLKVGWGMECLHKSQIITPQSSYYTRMGKGQSVVERPGGHPRSSEQANIGSATRERPVCHLT